MKKDPLTYNPSTGKWHHALASQKVGGHLTRRECGEAYVRALIQKEPKYLPLITGKRWSEIFKILGIKMEGANDATITL